MKMQQLMLPPEPSAATRVAVVVERSEWWNRDESGAHCAADLLVLWPASLRVSVSLHSEAALAVAVVAAAAVARATKLATLAAPLLLQKSTPPTTTWTRDCCCGART